MLKKILPTLTLVASTLIINGCATHAVVEQTVVEKINSQNFENKSFKYNILYSKPKPGIFSGGEQLPLTPIEQAELSVASAQVLGRLNEILKSNLPNSVSIVSSQGDYGLSIAITAKNKKGPAFADYDMAASMGKSLLTLGLGSSEYTIIADFDIQYSLQDAKGREIHTNTYKVLEELDHEKSKFDGNDIGHSLAEQLLEKHINITLQDFLRNADTKV